MCPGRLDECFPTVQEDCQVALFKKDLVFGPSPLCLAYQVLEKNPKLRLPLSKFLLRAHFNQISIRLNGKKTYLKS